jgi:hypothetical protein
VTPSPATVRVAPRRLSRHRHRTVFSHRQQGGDSATFTVAIKLEQFTNTHKLIFPRCLTRARARDMDKSRGQSLASAKKTSNINTINGRYVLEGSVQRGGNRMHVNVQLIDAESGNHLWAERFDRPLTDLFDMQDEIVARLAGALNAQLVVAEARGAEKAPNPDSMDLYFQGLAWLNKGMTPDNVAQARSFFDRALTADPDNFDALIESARADARAGAFLFVTDPLAAFGAAEAKLTKALSSVPDHARAHLYLGIVDIFTKRAAQGTPNASTPWRWIEISPTPIPLSEEVRSLSVAPKKRRLRLPRPCA